MIDIFCCYIVHKHCDNNGYLTSICLANLKCDWVQRDNNGYLTSICLANLKCGWVHSHVHSILPKLYEALDKRGEFDD